MSISELQHHQRSSFNRVECFPYFAIAVRLRPLKWPFVRTHTKSSSYFDASNDLSRVCPRRFKYQCKRESGLFRTRLDTRTLGQQTDVQGFRFRCCWRKVCRTFRKVERYARNTKLDWENIFLSARWDYLKTNLNEGRDDAEAKVSFFYLKSFSSLVRSNISDGVRGRRWWALYYAVLLELPSSVFQADSWASLVSPSAA